MKPKSSAHRSRRLRKKLRIDDFQCLGFDVNIKLKEGLAKDASDQVFFDFVDHAIEANNLSCGGGGAPGNLHFFVMATNNKSATDTDRANVEAWLKTAVNVESYQVQPLIDAWYPDEDEQKAA